MIYIDNAATSPLRQGVIERLKMELEIPIGNPSSVHSLGVSTHKKVEAVREKLADHIGCEPEQVVFTSGGTEGNNMILLGIATHLEGQNKKHIISSRAEHASVYETLEFMRTKLGFDISYVNIDGSITADNISKLVREDTGLVSIMHVNNETGILNDIESIGMVCKENGILFHSDMVQSFGVVDTNVTNLNTHFCAFSGHKIGALQGTGFCYIKDSKILTPILHGGSQQGGVRPGTENVFGVLSIGAALDELFLDKNTPYYELMNTFINETYAQLGDANSDKIKFNIAGGNVPGKIFTATIQDVYAESLLLALSAKEIYASSGSACSEGDEIKHSRVLKAYGLSDDDIEGTIRISFSKHDTHEDTRMYAIKFIDIVKKILMM